MNEFPFIGSTGIKINHIVTNDEEIESMPIKNGSIYLCADSGAIYYDFNNERKKILEDIIRTMDGKFSNVNNSIFNINEAIQDSIAGYEEATNEQIDALFNE